MNSLASLERRHLHHVPASEWHGKVWRQGPFWFLGNFQPFTVALAFFGPVVGLNGLWTSVAGISGILLGAMLMAAHAAQGPRLGLPQMVQSRAQFGYCGVILPVTATTFTFVGFNVVIVVIVKQGLAGIFGWNAGLVSVVASAMAALIAIYGHDWIHRVVLVVFWLSLPLWVAVTAGIVAGGAGGNGPTTGGFNTVGFLAMFAVAASYNITYAPIVSDYSRYLARDTSRRAIISAVFIGAVGSPIWLIPVGAWMATRLHVSDALTGISLAGNATMAHLGTALVLVSVGALVATMAMSAYSGMLSVLTVIDSLRPVRTGPRVRVVTILALAVTWLILGVLLTNASTVLSDSLLLMLYLLAPWTSVNLTDYYLVRHGRYAIHDLFTPAGVYGRWGARGISAYLIGIAVEIPFMSIPGLYQSPGANWLRGVDVSWILGLLVAGGSYLLIARTLDRTGESAAVERSELALRTATVTSRE